MSQIEPNLLLLNFVINQHVCQSHWCNALLRHQLMKRSTKCGIDPAERMFETVELPKVERSPFIFVFIFVNLISFLLHII